MLIKKHKDSAKIKNNQHDQSKTSFCHHIADCLPQQKSQRSHRLQQHGQMYSFIMILGVMSLMMLLLLPLLCVDAVGYSYTRFIGPVTGPEHKIYVNDDNSATDGKTQQHGSGTLRLDYVGKPEYEFAYGVEDTDAHILHNRNEMRDGDAVKGVYSLIDPDGTLRVVKYTADGINGFQAEVIRNGVSQLHGQLQHDYNRAPPSNTISYNHNNIYRPGHEQQYYSQAQTHLKGDKNIYHPSSNSYTNAPNLKQLSQINYENYNPQNQYHQTPPQSSIIYHYNKNDDDSGDKDSSSSSNVSNGGHQAQYEVYEKINDDNLENQDDSHYNKNGNGHKLNKEQQPDKHDEDKDKDHDDNYDDDESDSEELEDYDENIHNTQNSEESDEYY